MAETIYSAEQIRIPPELPEILKNYAKFVIKTQPVDILLASSEYFKIMIGILDACFGSGSIKSMATRKDIDDAAAVANIPITQVADILTLGGWTTDRIAWIKFWSLLCASAAGTFFSTLELVMEIVGDNGKVSVSIVSEVFNSLAEFDKSVDRIGMVSVQQLLASLSGKDYSIDALIGMIKKEFASVQPQGSAPAESAPEVVVPAVDGQAEELVEELGEEVEESPEPAAE